MSMLQSTIVDTIRHGVPVTGAVVGAVVAGKKAKSPTLVNLGLYTLGGWAAGYVVRLIVLEGIGSIFRKPLPQKVASIKSPQAPQAAPSAPGFAGVPSQPKPTVQEATTPPPVQKDTSGNTKDDVKVKGTLFSDAYGAL